MPDTPLVTLITPTCGRREFWSRSLKCFYSQDYPRLEWVVLDDSSTDPIKDLLPEDSRIRYYYELPKQSHGRKMNRCCELASGEFFCVWDDDDWYAPDRITKQIQPLIDNPHLMVSGTSQLYYYVHKAQPQAYRYVNLTNMAWIGAIALRKSAWETHKFNDKPHGADFDLLQMIPRDQWCDLNDLTLMVSTIHPGNAAPKGLPNPSFVTVPWAEINALTKGAL